MPDTMPTLLVIHDDLIAPLTPWPVDVVEPALYCPKGRGDHRDGYLPEDGYFIGRTYERFGAVGVLNVYRTRFRWTPV